MAVPAKRQYQDLADRLIQANRPEVRVGRVYGIPMLLWQGKAFAGFNQDALVVHLGGATLAKAQALKGAKPFAHNGQELAGWVQIPAVQVSHWRVFAEDALFFAGRG